MLYHAKNGSLPLRGSTMDYIRFGSGSKVLLILPGLGDGLQTVKGTALPMAAAYRMFAREYTVYAFSRGNSLSPECTTADMAAEAVQAMDALGIRRADIFGVSMGGMIAQHMAIRYPQRVGRLILAVTCARTNPILEEAMEEWLACARRDDHAGLMDSNVRRIYSEQYYRKNRWLVPVMGRLTKPKSYDRFFCQAQACLTHDTYDALPFITAPTLVIGGGQDRCLGCDASRELAERIPGARLRIYPQWGHGVYEEAPDFNRVVLSFLQKA